MSAFQIFKIIINPVFLCSLFIPLLVHFSYRFLKTKYAKDDEKWIKKIIETPFFDVVLVHAIHLILFWAAYVIFILQYAKTFMHINDKIAGIEKTINYMFTGGFSVFVNLFSLGFILAVFFFTLKNNFAEEHVLEGYKERFESDKWYPPNNLLTWCRGIIVFLAIIVNLWERYSLAQIND